MIIHSIQIRGYPTIKFFAAGPKEFSSAKDYDGGRTSSDIVQWAMNHYTETLPAPEVYEVSNCLHSFPSSKVLYLIQHFM